MTFQFKERRNSRRTTSHPPTFTYEYVANGSNDPVFVKSFAVSGTPTVVSTVEGTLYRQDIVVQPVSDSIYYITIPYALSKKETGNWRFSYDTTGGTAHIKTSRTTVNTYKDPAEPKAPPDYKNLIGVRRDESGGIEVDGTDIVVPALTFSIIVKQPVGVLTIAHMKTMARSTGTVNSDVFLTFQPGELLFLGSNAQGSDAEGEEAFQFGAAENEAGVTIGDIAGISNEGFDFVWTEPRKKAVGGLAVLVPRYVYVERVYKRLDFGLTFGIS